MVQVKGVNASREDECNWWQKHPLQITTPPMLQFSHFSLGRLNVTLAKLIHISWAWILNSIFSDFQAIFFDLIKGLIKGFFYKISIQLKK